MGKRTWYGKVASVCGSRRRLCLTLRWRLLLCFGASVGKGDTPSIMPLHFHGVWWCGELQQRLVHVCCHTKVWGADRYARRTRLENAPRRALATPPLPPAAKCFVACCLFPSFPRVGCRLPFQSVSAAACPSVSAAACPSSPCRLPPARPSAAACPSACPSVSAAACPSSPVRDMGGTGARGSYLQACPPPPPPTPPHTHHCCHTFCAPLHADADA